MKQTWFWGLAAESSVAAAGALGINVRAESYAVAAEQAEADSPLRC